MKRVILLMSLVAFMLLDVAAKGPVFIHLVGDEVVAEEVSLEDVTATSPVGWGQVLGEYLEGVEIINRAFAGASTRSLLNGGDWADILSNANRGSVMLIALGIHDYEETDSLTYSSLEVFEYNLLQMAEEATKNRVKVVLLTPVTKRFYYDSEFYPRHGAYAEGVRRVAAQKKLPLIDLEAETRAMVEEAGELGSAVYFAGDSQVELSADGARAVAQMVANGLKELKIVK